MESTVVEGLMSHTRLCTTMKHALISPSFLKNISSSQRSFIFEYWLTYRQEHKNNSGAIV